MKQSIVSLLICLVAPAEAAISNPFNKVIARVDNAIDDLNPFDDHDGDDAKPLSEVAGPAVLSALTTLYGSSLLLYSHYSLGQLHILTMFRATGQDKLEMAVEAARRNIRDAVFAIIRRAPTFLLARRSINQIDERIKEHRQLVAQNRKAKEDGIVTKREARTIARMKKQEIRKLKRDMRRVGKACVSLRDVFQALDFDELSDIGKSFFVQLLAVLATGHQDSAVGTIIARWCLFLNLGSLIYETNKNLGFPIAQLVLRRGSFKGKKLNPDVVSNTGKLVVYGSSAYLVTGQNMVARKLNTSLLASAVVMRGLRSFVRTMLAWDDDDDDGIWPSVGRFLNGRTGGLLMVSLATYGYMRRNKGEQGELDCPSWVRRPLDVIESAIKRLSNIADKIV